MLKMIENVKNVSPRIKVYGIQIVTRIKSWLGTRVVLETVWMGSADVDRIRFSHQIFFSQNGMMSMGIGKPCTYDGNK